MNDIIKIKSKYPASQKEEIEKAIEKAGDGDAVFFEGGKYFVDGQIKIENKNNLIICGDDATIVAHFDPKVGFWEFSGILAFKDCKNITLKQLTFDTDNPVNCAGTVVDKSAEDFTIDVMLFDGCTLDSSQTIFASCSLDEDCSPDYLFADYTKREYKSVGENTVRIQYSGSQKEMINNLPIGANFVIRHGLGNFTVLNRSSITFTNCDDTVMEDITVYNSAGYMVVVFPRCNNFTIRRYRVVVPQGSHRFWASNIDGIHLLGLTGECIVEDCYFDGGETADYGGNVNNGSAANFQYLNCTLINGKAKRGGNYYAGATSSRATLTGTRLIAGSATTFSGNVHSGNGYFDFKGGEILFGTAVTYGGNITANAGNYSATSNNYTRIATDEDGNVPLIAGGTAGKTGGNIHLSGVLYLDAAKITGGKAGTTGNDIHMHKLSKQSLFSVGSGVTGEMSVYIDSSFFGDGGYGAFINNTACDYLNARIVLEGDYQGALLCAADGKLSIGAIAVVDAAGTYTWYADIAEAINKCPIDGYIRLYAAQDVVLTKDCAIDICGPTVNVSGAYTVYGLDSSGDDFTIPTGKLIPAAETAVASNTDVCGKQYIAVTEETGTSFHRIQAQITEVALRPSVDGLYYTGSFGCDELVGANIESYGIAVSTVNMPGADFMTDDDTLYTEFIGSTMENGAKKTGVLISGIMKEERTAELNSAYGQMPIFATAFLKLKDGSVVLSDTDSHTDDIAYSLKSMLATLDSLIMEDPIHYRKLTNPLRSFHNKWREDGMGDWDLNKIPDPGDNGIIDVLFIGGSFNYYYVEELYGIAEAAGIPMRVCNLYYSGAGPKQHWTWWKNGESPCQFFNTDGNGRVKTANVSLEWALAQAEWDVLTMQYPSGTVKTATAQQGFDDLDVYSRELSDYLHEQFPNAMQCWGQVWAYQVGYDRDGYTVPDRETQLGLYQRHKELAYIAADAYDRVLIPCGEAWEFVRQGGYDNLCARLGKGTNHEGDYYHEGDIGGGQYLNACVWFEMITGESCVGNTYVPSYVYSDTTYNILEDITIAELQNAAHRAVEDCKN